METWAWRPKVQPGQAGEGKSEAELSDRVKELENNSCAEGSRGLDLTGRGDETRQSGGNIGQDRTGVSRSLGETGVEGKVSRVGTREGTGFAHHRSARQRSAPGSGKD